MLLRPLQCLKRAVQHSSTRSHCRQPLTQQLLLRRDARQLGRLLHAWLMKKTRCVMCCAVAVVWQLRFQANGI